MKFAQLSLHSEYSVTDGIVRLKPLMQLAKEQGYSAIALTDFNNVYGHVKFYKLAKQFGIKAIFGADIAVVSTLDPTVTTRLSLLCINNAGHLNLMKIISKSYQLQTDKVVVQSAWLTPESVAGLVCLSAGLQGELAMHLLAEKKIVCR